mmetsp:Transcript_42096/g.134483  ORF Transcript_42096/g.134483 Transcript_42096/m.134483 type:complete len:236 (-) Transcript_42096:446-1153(-)
MGGFSARYTHVPCGGSAATDCAPIAPKYLSMRLRRSASSYGSVTSCHAWTLVRPWRRNSRTPQCTARWFTCPAAPQWREGSAPESLRAGEGRGHVHTPSLSKVMTVLMPHSLTAASTYFATLTGSHCVRIPSGRSGSLTTLTRSGGIPISLTASAISPSRTLPSPAAPPLDRQRMWGLCPPLASCRSVGAKNMHSSSGWAVTSSTAAPSWLMGMGFCSVGTMASMNSIHPYPRVV